MGLWVFMNAFHFLLYTLTLSKCTGPDWLILFFSLFRVSIWKFKVEVCVRILNEYFIKVWILTVIPESYFLVKMKYKRKTSSIVQKKNKSSSSRPASDFSFPLQSQAPSTENQILTLLTCLDAAMMCWKTTNNQNQPSTLWLRISALNLQNSTYSLREVRSDMSVHILSCSCFDPSASLNVWSRNDSKWFDLL